MFQLARSRSVPSKSHLFASCTRLLHHSPRNCHENPLGLPRRSQPPPTIPRRSREPIQKRAIPNVKTVIAVASGKGGVGKSTVAVNLAISLALRRPDERPLQVGILDLDIFGPSIPGLMGLDKADEPFVTESGALIPLQNHGIKCMSMGFLLPPLNSAMESDDTAVVWRGLMVQKAVQQLLFDVDWRGPLDVLIVDLPPGTGDVALTLGQLVDVNGAVIVSAPQNVALYDVRRGIAMFRKLSIPILGLILNQSHFYCSNCSHRHLIYGPVDPFYDTASSLKIDVLGELPMVSSVSTHGNSGVPFVLGSSKTNPAEERGYEQWVKVMGAVREKIQRLELI